MDQHIFDQLDKLEAGARADTRPHRENYNRSTGYSVYESHGHASDHVARGGRQWTQAEDGGKEDPLMALEPFGGVPPC